MRYWLKWIQHSGQLCITFYIVGLLSAGRCGSLLVCTIQVTTVKFRNWLRTLHQFSVAQTVLSSSHPHTSDVIPALCKASAIVYNAMMLTKVCSLIPRPSKRVWESD